MAADPVHAEQREREEHAVAQVGDREQVFQRVFHSFHRPAETAGRRQRAAHPGMTSVPPLRSAARLTPAAGCLRAVQHFRRAAGRRDLFRRLAAELVRAHGQLLRDVAAREHLERLPAAVNQPRLEQQLGRDHRAGVEALLEHVEVHHRVFGAERVVEPTLRDAAMQRHLAAFEPALELESRARLRPLVPAARLHALARALAAAHALLRVLRARGGLQIAEIHNRFSSVFGLRSSVFGHR